MLIEGRRDEQSAFQTKDIESKETKDGETNRLEQTHRNNNNNSKSKCRNCGREFPHIGTCPARGKTCSNCGKSNHFATVCRAKQNPVRLPRKTTKGKQQAQKNIKTLDTEQNSSSDEEYLYTIIDKKSDNKVNVTIGGSQIKIAVDTGATINVIDYNTFEKMKDVKLTRTNMKAFAYSKKSPVEFIGKFEALIETKKRMSVATFFGIVQNMDWTHGLDPKLDPKLLNFFQEKTIRIHIYRQKTLRLHNFTLNVTDLYIYLLFKVLNDSNDNTQERYDVYIINLANTCQTIHKI